LQDLREFVTKHGKATQHMIANDKAMPAPATYAARFGSLQRAVEMITAEQPKGFSSVQLRLRLKWQLQDEFSRTLGEARIPSRKNCGVYTSSEHCPVLLDVARCYTLVADKERWEIRYSKKGGEGISCIAARLSPDNCAITDYVFIPSLPKAAQRVRLSESHIRRIGSIIPTLGEAVQLLLSNHKTSLSATSAHGEPV
jgi:hypothetical protein